MKRDTLTLDDKYALERGCVFLTGTQALVRLTMLQQVRDQATGLNTAGYVSRSGARSRFICFPARNMTVCLACGTARGRE